jgi:hypothetical protein
MLGTISAVTTCVLAAALLVGQDRGWADNMFKGFENVSFAQGTSDAVPGNTIVMGISGADTAKA